MRGAAPGCSCHHPFMGNCGTVIRALHRHGLLLQQDKKVLNVVGIITGEALSSSWWNHARGSDIFNCLARIVDRDDVVMTRLIARKLTYVHERLWPALLAVAMSRERWQTNGLSTDARALLRRVESRDAVEATGAEARDLQNRLLVRAMEVHTTSGRHVMALQSWASLASRSGAVDVEEGKRELETAAAAIGARVSTLPWNRRSE